MIVKTGQNQTQNPAKALKNMVNFYWFCFDMINDHATRHKRSEPDQEWACYGEQPVI